MRNEPVDMATLPAWEHVELIPVAARYAPCCALGILLWGLTLAAAIALAPALDDTPVLGDLRVASGLFAAFSLAAVLAWAEARRHAWALREHDLIHRSGLIVRTTALVPLTRVQHVEISSGPVERAFGLVRLNCYTAGGLSTDLVIAGLEPTTAERVRRYLLERLRVLDAPAAAASADGRAPEDRVADG